MLAIRLVVMLLLVLRGSGQLYGHVRHLAHLLHLAVGGHLEATTIPIAIAITIAITIADVVDVDTVVVVVDNVVVVVDNVVVVIVVIVVAVANALTVGLIV